jgi:hypothetical protein
MTLEKKENLQVQDSESFPVWKAVTVGWLLVNLPILVIIFCISLIGALLVPNGWWIFLFVAFLLGWLWWSFTVPRWRRWAVGRGANPSKLQRWAAITGLVWRKGSIFEKTEFRR